ncbi:FGGY-family carbohydrate kinase [Pseudothermotoga sp.]
MPKLVLSVDCGTQSLKALAFDEAGNLIDMCKVGYPQTYVSPRPGWAEQDLQVYESALSKACKTLFENGKVKPEEILAISVTSQRDTCLFLAKDGRALKRAILWLDQRMAHYDAKLPLHFRIGFKIVGMDRAAMISSKKCKANWVRQNEPEIWKETHKFLLLSGWFNYLLTGKFVDSIASQIGHIPFNYKKQTWADPGRDFHPYLFPIDREKLPELVPPGTVLGGLTGEASKLTGLKQGTPVVASGSDKGCETLGAGCIEESMACASLGTTTTLQITSEKYLEPIKFMPSYPAVIPGKFNPEVEIFRGFWMVTWFKEQFAAVEAQIARERNVSTEEVLEELLLQTEPGSFGLVLQPYWGAGLKQPEARGAIVGFGDVHNRAYLYRAIIEGLAYALRDAAEKIEKVSKTAIEKIVATGGGSRSNMVCQILSDVMNRKVLRTHVYEAAGLGSAIVSFCGLGFYKSFEEAVRNMVRYVHECDPNPERSSLYQKLYRSVYKRLYPRLRPLYRAMQRITNYPEM